MAQALGVVLEDPHRIGLEVAAGRDQRTDVEVPAPVIEADQHDRHRRAGRDVVEAGLPSVHRPPRAFRRDGQPEPLAVHGMDASARRGDRQAAGAPSSRD
jgi:hypothetical protein